MPTISTSIEIAAPPTEVRRVFLDFPQWPQWSKAFMTNIEVISGDKNNLKSGDKLRHVTPGMTFNSTVTENTPEKFAWCGSIPLIFSGTHAFYFRPSETTPGGTSLLQEEVFTGLASFMMGDTWSGGKNTRKGFEGLNGDIKARVEGFKFS